MNRFATMAMPVDPTVVAPDGSDVRVLSATSRGSMAHFELSAGRTSRAIRHRTVEEIWLVLAGRGEIWRKLDDHEEIVSLVPGICLTIPHGTLFQFRASAESAVSAVGVTMPPWPGDGEAEFVAGPWTRSA